VKETEIRAGGEHGFELPGQAKAAAIVRCGGRAYVLADGGVHVTVQNNRSPLTNIASTEQIKVSWPSWGAVSPADAKAFEKALTVANAIAEEATRIEHPFKDVPAWVTRDLDGLDYDQEIVIYEASRAYETGMYTHPGAWVQAIKRVRETRV